MKRSSFVLVSLVSLAGVAVLAAAAPGSGHGPRATDTLERAAALDALAARHDHDSLPAILALVSDAAPAVRASRVFRGSFVRALTASLAADLRGASLLVASLERVPVDLWPLLVEPLREIGRDDTFVCLAALVGRTDAVDREVARALGAWSPFHAARTDGRCVELLVALHEHDAAPVRRAATEALDRHAGGGALDELAKRLEDGDPLTRAAAERALRRLTGRSFTERAGDWTVWMAHERTFEANHADRLHDALAGPDAFEALEALRELAKHPRRPEWRAAALEAALGHSEVNVALAAAAALARLGDVRSVPALVDALADPRPVVADGAAAALTALTGTPRPGPDWRPRL